MSAAAAVVLVGIVGVIGVVHQWALPRVRTDRPPVGRFDAGDLAVVLVFTTGVPLLWLRPPAAVGSVVFAIVLFSLSRIGLEPVMSARPATVAALALCVAEGALWVAGARTAAMSINNVLLAVAVIAVSVFWIQLGMRATHVAVFAAALVLYDVAGFVLGFMQRLGDVVELRPFSPQLAVMVDDVRLSIGLGDVLLIVLWAGAVRKAYGRPAAVAAQIIGVAMLGSFVAAGHAGVVDAFPMMVVWGPLVGVHWLVLRLRHGRERTVAEWVAAERIPALRGRLLADPPVSSPSDLRATLAADVRRCLALSSPGDDRVPR